MASWELPASLSKYGQEGHISNEGEDVVKRIWDLLSSIAAHPKKSDNLLMKAAPHPDFDRSSAGAAFNATDLKSMWAQQDAINASVSGAYTKYNGPMDHPRHYLGPGEVFPTEVLPAEMLFEMQGMLFDNADAGAIIDFIDDVRDFNLDYQTSVADSVRRLLLARNGTSFGMDPGGSGTMPGKRRREYEKARNLSDGGRPIVVKESVFQLVPGVSSSWSSGVKQAVWRHGYWHIARSQIMHFKYDQSLEMYNGIHAAVRGKLLEATFAPVWVEPLECSVMGGGYGEQGSTTAQTFARGSNVSTSGGLKHSAKRPKVHMKLGTRALELSTLMNSYCQLQDQVARFNAKVQVIDDKFVKDPTYSSWFFRDSDTKQMIHALWPAYHKIRMDKDALDKRHIPTEAECVSKEVNNLRVAVEACKKGIKEMVAFNLRNPSPTVVSDAWVCQCLLSWAIKGSFLSKNTVDAVLSRTHTLSFYAMSNVNIDPIHHGLLHDEVMLKPHVEMESWKEAILFPGLVVAAAKLVQNNYDQAIASPLAIWSGRNDHLHSMGIQVISVLLAEKAKNIQFKADGTTPRPLNEIQMMGVMLMPFLAIDQAVFHLNLNGAHTLDDLLIHHLDMLVNVHDRNDFVPAVPAGVVTTPDHLDIIYNMFKRSFKCIKELGIQDGGIQVMMGAFMGGMFALSAGWHCYYFIAGIRRICVLPSENAPNPFPTAGSERRAKLAQQATSKFMVAAGIILGGLATDQECRESDFMAKLGLAMYLVYLELNMKMVKKFGGDDFNNADQPKINAKKTELDAHIPDLVEVCRRGWACAKTYWGSGVDQLSRERHVSNAYRPIQDNNYMERKTDAAYTSDILRQEDNVTLVGNGDVHNVTGMVKGRNIADQLYQVLANKTTSKDKVYKIIYYSLQCLDAPPFGAGGARGAGTNTAGPMADADTMQLSAVVDDTEGLLVQQQSIPPTDGMEQGRTNASKITLGSILLDKSEKEALRQQQQQGETISHADSMEEDIAGTRQPSALKIQGDAVPTMQVSSVSEEEEDENEQGVTTTTAAVVTTSPTVASEEKGGKGGNNNNSKTGKSGFRRVQAKLL